MKRISDKLHSQDERNTLLQVIEDYLTDGTLPTPDIPMSVRRTFAQITRRIRGDTDAVQVEVQTDPYTFDLAWNAYQKKVGSKEKLKKKWQKLPRDTRRRIIEYIPLYVTATPDKKYRKNFETFLNNQSWNDEIIQNGTATQQQQQLTEQQQLAADAAAAIAAIRTDNHQ